MIATLKAASFLIFIGLLGRLIFADMQPISDKPCDYRECPTCPFPCERHGK